MRRRNLQSTWLNLAVAVAVALCACAGVTGSGAGPGGDVSGDASRQVGNSLDSVAIGGENSASDPASAVAAAYRQGAAPGFPGGQPAPDFTPQDVEVVALSRFNIIPKTNEDLSYDYHAEKAPVVTATIFGELTCATKEPYRSMCHAGAALKLMSGMPWNWVETPLITKEGDTYTFSATLQISPLPNGAFNEDTFFFYLSRDPTVGVNPQHIMPQDCRTAPGCSPNWTDPNSPWRAWGTVGASYDKTLLLSSGPVFHLK